MGPIVPIDDPDDPRLDDYRNLTDAELRKRDEPRAGLFMVEGPAVIRVLLPSAYPTRSLLLNEARLDELRPDLEASGAGCPIFVAHNDVVRTITGFHFHRGALASAGRLPAQSWAGVVAAADRVVVAEEVGDHENLGALFRNAAAFGVHAVLLSPGAVDPLYRRAVRVSMGQVLRVPWARAEPWPAMLADLREQGFRILALTPHPSALALAKAAAPSANQRTAVLVGTEGFGLTAAARSLADVEARIPMSGGVDSLNVATAAAIALYELTR